MAELPVKFTPMATAFLMSADVPYHIIESLNEYLDKLHIDKKRESHAKSLVGQIKKGQQLRMDDNDPLVKEFSKLCCTLANGYIDCFTKTTGVAFNKLIPEMDEIWSVHSFEGDYNPIHSHSVKALTGVSCTTWTKIPKQIRDKKPSVMGDLYDSSGECDGFITFYYGGVGSNQDAEILRPPTHYTLKPEIGTMYFFPTWMQHSVYPFFGEGERRTVAANINMWPEEVLKMREQNKGVDDNVKSNK